MRHRRAEGHAEYVVILSLIMLCGLTSLMAMTDGIKDVYSQSGMQVCVDCPITMTDKELADIEAELSDREADGTITDEDRELLEDVRRETKRREDKAAIEEAGDAPTDEAGEATAVDNFLWSMAEIFSWFGGGRYWWELFGLV